MAHLHDLRAVAAEDDGRHGEEEILHVRTLLDEETVQLVAELELLNVLVLCLLFRLLVKEPHALAVAGQHVVELVLAHHHVVGHLLDDLVGQLVVVAEGYVEVTFALDGDGLVGNVAPRVVEDGAGVVRVFGVGRAGLVRAAEAAHGVNLRVAPHSHLLHCRSLSLCHITSKFRVP